MFHPDRVSFIPLVTGTAGQTITIPAIPEETGSGFSQPSIRLPAVPSIFYPTIVPASGGGAVNIDGIKYVYGGYLTDIASGGTHYLHVSSALSSLAELGDTTLAAGDVHNSTYTGWRTTDDAAANFIVIADVEIIAGTAPPSSGWVTLSLQRTRVVGTIHTNFSHGSCEFPVGTFGGDDANSFSLIGYTKLNNLVAEGFQFSIKNNTDGDVQINSLLCTFIKVS